MSNEKRQLRIVIACGSGLCSSGVAKVKILELAEELGIPADVQTCNISEIMSEVGRADILCTTMPYQFPDEVQYGINVFPLITGINAEACKNTLREWMKGLAVA